jgi:hypothetical protein
MVSAAYDGFCYNNEKKDTDDYNDVHLDGSRAADYQSFDRWAI